ncbi:MAG: DUF309 domain-containing protein [Terracidiphilus sp.]
MSWNWRQGALAEGLRRYRSGEFFLAHEDWESVWLGLREPEKSFLQAIIQVSAALHHFHTGNRVGALSLMKRARKRIDASPGKFFGLRVDILCEDLAICLRSIEQGASPSAVRPPRIRLL